CSPFLLSYGTEGVIPTKYHHPVRDHELTDEENEFQLACNLTWIDKTRDRVIVNLGRYYQTLANSYNKRVRTREFAINDWVLREIPDNRKDSHAGKLAKNWEGPFMVIGRTGLGSYYLMTEVGDNIPNPWNTRRLKLYRC
ncbi:hypothetical protein GIB67_014076, partial [Kingdonia uniflora]